MSKTMLKLSFGFANARAPRLSPDSNSTKYAKFGIIVMLRITPRRFPEVFKPEIP
jgi:hypothetical protein